MKDIIRNNTFRDSESRCELIFHELSPCWHLYTPERFEIIFATEDDFKAGMTLLAICAIAFPEIKILTFELMSNHLHITVAGQRRMVLSFFELFRKHLEGYLHGIGRPVSLSSWECQIREIADLRDLRTVIVYNNRNGYLVNPSMTPFSYPWGANRFFFNPELRCFHESSTERMTVEEIRRLFRTRSLDGYAGLKTVAGSVTPIAFCDIGMAEKLFRDARQYFYKLSRDVESQKSISAELGENIFYTDDELYSIVVSKSRSQYNVSSPSLLPPETKMEFARMLHFEYHANNKQIARMLRLDRSFVESFFPESR